MAIPANIIQEYNKVLQPLIAQQIVAGSTSGWMEGNASQVQFTGGKGIKVPVLETNGLGDYARNAGAYDNTVDLSYITREMTMDRGTNFNLDEQDIEETNFALQVNNVITTFNKTHVIPEIDCYRYSKLFTDIAKAKGRESEADNFKQDALTKDNILETILTDIDKVKEETGNSIPLVCIISKPEMLKLRVKHKTELDKVQFVNGVIDTEVTGIDDVPFLEVPSKRMKTSYQFYNGTSDGQTAGGCVPGSTSKDINYMIVPACAPIGITKVNKLGLIMPDSNMDMFAYRVKYRLYHDLWTLPCYADISVASVKKVAGE